MITLTNEQKLYILYTKGHFSKYKNAKEIILAKAFSLYPEHINERNTVSFMISLVAKLANAKLIEMNYEKSIEWLLREFADIGNGPLKTFHDWLYSQIQGCYIDGLDLDNVDKAIETKMTLINGLTSNNEILDLMYKGILLEDVDLSTNVKKYKKGQEVLLRELDTSRYNYSVCNNNTEDWLPKSTVYIFN